MTVQLESLPTPARVGQWRVAARVTEPGGRMPVVVADPIPHVTEPLPATKVLVRRDDRAGLLIVFVAATLVMVVVVALVDAVGQWWVLVPAMLIDLMLTVIIIAVITRLLADEGESVPSEDAR